MISYLKGYGIRTALWLTDMFEPFEEFTRPEELASSLSLAYKADLMRESFSKFIIRNGTTTLSRLSLDPLQPEDIGDQALWHGVYSAFVYVNPKFAEGLMDHQPNGRLIRGIDSNGRAEDYASNDSACGHLVGLAAYDLRAEAEMWAKNVRDAGGCLLDPDNKPTKYGVLDNGWKSDPLRITLLLAIYKLGGLEKEHQALKRKHYGMLAYPYARLLWWGNYQDLLRGALQLNYLAKQDPDTVFRKGLLSLMKIARKHGNVFVMALCGEIVGFTEADRELALKVMREFPIKDLNRGVQLSEKMPHTKWGEELVARQPLPKWKKWNQDFEWQRNPYALDSRLPAGEADSYLNGGDYLAAYNLGLKIGLFNKGD